MEVCDNIPNKWSPYDIDNDFQENDEIGLYYNKESYEIDFRKNIEIANSDLIQRYIRDFSIYAADSSDVDNKYLSMLLINIAGHATIL